MSTLYNVQQSVGLNFGLVFPKSPEERVSVRTSAQMNDMLQTQDVFQAFYTVVSDPIPIPWAFVKNKCILLQNNCETIQKESGGPVPSPSRTARRRARHHQQKMHDTGYYFLDDL